MKYTMLTPVDRVEPLDSRVGQNREEYRQGNEYQNRVYRVLEAHHRRAYEGRVRRRRKRRCPPSAFWRGGHLLDSILAQLLAKIRGSVLERLLGRFGLIREGLEHHVVLDGIDDGRIVPANVRRVEAVFDLKEHFEDRRSVLEEIGELVGLLHGLIAPDAPAEGVEAEPLPYLDGPRLRAFAIV